MASSGMQPSPGRDLSRDSAEQPSADEVLDALGCAIAVLDASGTIVATNAAWAAFTADWGAAGDHYLDAHRDEEHGDIGLVLQEGIQRVLLGRSPRFELEYPVGRSGGRRWHLLVATPLAGRPGWGVVAHVDVTSHHDVRDILDARAHLDALTGLPNRRAMGERLANAVNRARRDGTPVSVLFLDLNGFKAVNDGFGHDVGDEVLTAVGRRLAGTIRADDALGRWGGDEFVVVLDGGEEAVRSLSARLHAAMAQPVAVAGSRSVEVRLSVGATEAHAGDTPEDVVARADRAMFRAKRSGDSLVFDGAAPVPAAEAPKGDR